MPYVSIKEVRSATGRGTRDGTRETEGDINMVNLGKPMGWTNKELKLAGELIKGHTATEVGKI